MLSSYTVENFLRFHSQEISITLLISKFILKCFRTSATKIHNIFIYNKFMQANLNPYRSILNSVIAIFLNS